MKASLLAVLALILCADQANALYCYTCDWEQSNWRCLKAEKCSDKDEYCVTNVASVGIGSLSFWKRITKKCSETCPHHNFMLGLASYTSYCCQTFLCNLSACPGPRLARHYAMLRGQISVPKEPRWVMHLPLPLY